MKNYIAKTSLIMALALFSFGAQAQEVPQAAPIFITPYAVKKVTQMPTFVRPTSTGNVIRGENTRTYTRAGRKSPQIAMAESVNPFEGTGFGRIRTEKTYYDRETRTHMNQYDYMGALARRGETAKMQQVASYLQQNGVFDPAKFQAALTGNTQQANTPQNPVAIGTPSSRVTASGQPRVFQMKDQSQSAMPQRVHGGYDEGESETQDPAQNIPQGRRPIFLR